MPTVIEAKGLTKKYERFTAVDNLDLKIEEGTVFGFLGPNGAGKTTTILMLMGLTEPSGGEARIGGFNSTREPLKVKRITGYIPEKVGFYEDLTAYYNLLYMARLNGISDEEADKKITSALEKVGLKDKAESTVNTFSKGMKQRLAIAELIVKGPKVAFMDEPTSGIDPEGIAQMLDLISAIAKEHNMTIVISSHQLNQVEHICSRVGIMSKGKLVMEGSVNQLGQRTGGGKILIELQLAEITSEIIDGIKGVVGVQKVERKDDSLLITCNEDLRRQISRVIQEKNGLLVQMKLQSYALEDIYLKIFREAQ
jgi:ABC-2 type transport system ATP-binding protein